MIVSNLFSLESSWNQLVVVENLHMQSYFYVCFHDCSLFFHTMMIEDCSYTELSFLKMVKFMFFFGLNVCLFVSTILVDLLNLQLP